MTAKPLSAALALTFLLSACNDSPTEPPGVASIEATGPATMVEGETALATASVFDQNGNILPDVTVEWTSSAQEIATIDPTGTISALQAGPTTITASANGVSDSFVVEVRTDPCESFVGEISLGETVEGELTEESCFIQEWFHDPWAFELEADADIRVDLVSEDFDAFLILTDALGNEIAADDDSGEGTNAQLSGELSAGSYILWASTVDEADTGAYELSVVDVEADLLAAPAIGEITRPRGIVPVLRSSRGAEGNP